MSQPFEDKVKRFTDTRMTKQLGEFWQSASDEAKERIYTEMSQELRSAGFTENASTVSREDMARRLYVAHGGELPSMEGHFQMYRMTYLNMADAALWAVGGEEFGHES